VRVDLALQRQFCARLDLGFGEALAQ